MGQAFPDVIELVPNQTGSYVPDFNARPASPAPIVPVPPPVEIPLYREPPTTPTYDSGSRGMSDQDVADFGTDQYGRPAAVRNPTTGRVEWNPDYDLNPDVERAANDYFNGDTGNRGTRRNLGNSFSRAVAGTGVALASPDPFTVAEIAVSFADFNNQLGSLIGTPLGRALRPILRPNAPPIGAPSGNIQVPGDPTFEGGQCVGTLYNVKLDVVRRITSDNTLRRDTTSRGGSITNKIYGPIRGVVIDSSGWKLVFSDIDGNQVIRQGATAIPGIEFVSVTISSIRTLDNSVDNCGNLEGEPEARPIAPPTPLPTAPSFPPELGLPPGYRAPETGTPPGPAPDPQRPPDDRYPPGVGLPDFGDLPTPAPAPAPDDNAPPTRPDVPTPNPDCCPSTERSLNCIKERLEDILTLVQGAGTGALDISPCLPSEDDTPTEATYEGEGMQGIYAAISAITQSLNLIHSDTKCPPPASSFALPMFWEIKRGEISQLVVIWRKIEGGGSSWSMTIPHPRAEIDADYPFDFPTYKKGGNMASVRLTDGSKIIINAFSEADAQSVIDYILSALVDPEFIPEGARVVYSTNVADLAEVTVKAQYVKKFQGHRTTAPLWAKHITST